MLSEQRWGTMVKREEKKGARWEAIENYLQKSSSSLAGQGFAFLCLCLSAACFHFDCIRDFISSSCLVCLQDCTCLSSRVHFIQRDREKEMKRQLRQKDHVKPRRQSRACCLYMTFGQRSQWGRLLLRAFQLCTATSTYSSTALYGVLGRVQKKVPNTGMGMAC